MAASQPAEPASGWALSEESVPPLEPGPWDVKAAEVAAAARQAGAAKLASGPAWATSLTKTPWEEDAGIIEQVAEYLRLRCTPLRSALSWLLRSHHLKQACRWRQAWTSVTSSRRLRSGPASPSTHQSRTASPVSAAELSCFRRVARKSQAKELFGSRAGGTPPRVLRAVRRIHRRVPRLQRRVRGGFRCSADCGDGGAVRQHPIASHRPFRSHLSVGLVGAGRGRSLRATARAAAWRRS